MKPVNLNKFRKAKARAEKKVRADENAIKYGRSKAQTRAEDAARKTQVARLDAHKRDGDAT
ncbi:MAG: DUF4169 family protein [Pseudomonadota bacterium]